MYRRFCTFNVNEYCITAYLFVSYGSYNKKKIFPYAATAGSLCNRDGEFTARYGITL